MRFFDLYFDKRPPFGAVKKKSEFPDAFALGALREWCDENSVKIYVVSEDPDLEKACADSPDMFLYSGELSEVIELALRDEGERIEMAHKLFSNTRMTVQERAEQAFMDLPMYLTDEDGEAYEVRVQELSLGDESVVSISENLANFYLLATVSFEADIEYADPNSVFRDDDTGDYLYLGSITETVTDTLEVPLEVSIEFDAIDADDNEVAEVVANSGEPLWIDVHERIY